MPAVIRQQTSVAWLEPPVSLGPQGPFPQAPLSPILERRWLHYAFLSRDGELGMVANIAWLGPDPDFIDARQRLTSILLVHRRNQGWQSTQFNAETLVPLWSAFRQPHPFSQPETFQLKSTAGSPAVDFKLQRSSRPCTSQAAPFAHDQHLRWQSETGVIAQGDWTWRGEHFKATEAVGYHERVRGFWGWPELGGWVFGFANDPAVTTPGAPPPTALVFTLIQPLAPEGSATASIMLWRNGQMRRHFPRRNIKVAVRGTLDRNLVSQVPELANLFNVPPMEAIPRRLVISAYQGYDWVLLDFLSEAAARVVIPNETGIDPFSVHEVIGACHIEGELNGERFGFDHYGIVEFAGGAGGL